MHPQSGSKLSGSTPQATAEADMKELRKLFAILETIVADNATCFVSAESEALHAYNGIDHLTLASYHSITNGLAKHTVQI